jgi:hypothetical protein
MHIVLHWGATWPLCDIIAPVADHWSYHAGEINALLAIRRGEAWEFGEHVEENHIAPSATAFVGRRSTMKRSLATKQRCVGRPIPIEGGVIDQ